MSLQIWLPCNGNLNNYGLTAGNATPTSSNYSFVTGKFGKSLTASSTTYCCCSTGSLVSTITSTNLFSMGAWVKTTATSGYIFNIGDYNNGAALKTRGLWMNNNGTFQWAYTGTGQTASTSSVNDGVWHHILFTVNGSTVKTYIDGVLNNTLTASTTAQVTGYEYASVRVGSSTAINDFRVYDHCLSEAEVKQISQGLVCHYKLSNQYEIGIKNKYSGNTSEGYLGYSGSFTRTKLDGERGYNYKFSYKGTGSNRWDSMYAGSTFSFTVGKKYFYSCKVRCHSKNFGFYLRAARSGNDWVTNTVNVLANADGKWHEYYVSQTINETYERSGTVKCNPILEFYTDTLSTSNKVYSADFDIKDIQVVESDSYVPFIDDTFSTNVVSDCSGFKNDGTISSVISMETGSPRYKECCKFSGTNYIKTGYSNSMNKLSCSFWVKPNSKNGGYAIIASNYNDPSTGFWIAVNCEGCALWFYNGAYVKPANTSLSNDTWYHACFTYDNGVGKWYINGDLAVSTDISSKGRSLTITNLSIGNSYAGSVWNTKFYGSISDFRLYATCLSAADVKSLYNTSASISNTGNLTAYEFEEEL